MHPNQRSSLYPFDLQTTELNTTSVHYLYNFDVSGLLVQYFISFNQKFGFENRKGLY